jgi:hypothetical protein
MTFFNCVADAIDEGSISRERGERAQEMWRDLRDRYTKAGHPEDVADALAAQDVKAAFKKEAGDKRHVFLATIGFQRRAQALVANAEDLGTLGTSSIEFMDGRQTIGGSLVGETHSLRRLFHYRLSDLIQKHHRNLAGNPKDKAGLMNVAKELHGQKTGDVAAQSVAAGVRDAFKEMRRMANDAGAHIGELDDWGLPHMHDKMALTRAGFDRWYADVKDNIAWHRIEDNLTGRPFAAEGERPPEATMQEFLRNIYDNNVFGEGSKEAVYGRGSGASLVRQLDRSRVLHFTDADAWIAYNTKYGSGDIYGSIIAHAHRMAEDIAAMRKFGPSPEMGLDYMKQLAVREARKRGDAALVDRVNGNFEHAKRMLRLTRGGAMPNSLKQATVARFFSSTRMLLSAAMLDRAIISSIADTNTARMAAKAMGLPNAPFKRHMDLVANGASREQLARAGWVADTMADPGILLSRFQAEVPAASIAERVSSGVMRAQGLAHWTDTGRHAFQFEMAGYLAENAGKPLDELPEPLRGLLRAKEVTQEDWALLTNPAHMFTAPNGATFLSPMWWRQVTDVDPQRADDIFLKVQSLIEEQTEFAVPTQNYWMRAQVEGDDVPGTIGYEMKKSALMVKSFAMTFSTNQIARIMATKQHRIAGINFTGKNARIAYGFDLAVGATLMGAIALQLGELAYGRDPQNMTDPSFWGRALLKGGGFGVVGDIVAAGESSWGGGFTSYAAGPGWQLVQDTWNLSVGNAADLMMGKETNFGRDLVKFADRYTPGADLPVLGLALDRILWDNLQRALDPLAEKAMREAATRRENLYGNRSFWQPGSPTPSRGPDLGAALGQ